MQLLLFREFFGAALPIDCVAGSHVFLFDTCSHRHGLTAMELGIHYILANVERV